MKRYTKPTIEILEANLVETIAADIISTSFGMQEYADENRTNDLGYNDWKDLFN